MLVAWDTSDGDEILTSLNYPWDRCDPVWCSGKVLDRSCVIERPGVQFSDGSCLFSLSQFSVCLLASASSLKKNKSNMLVLAEIMQSSYLKTTKTNWIDLWNILHIKKLQSYFFKTLWTNFPFLRGKLHPYQNWECFVRYIKIINTLLKNDKSILKQVVRKGQK